MAITEGIRLRAATARVLITLILVAGCWYEQHVFGTVFGADPRPVATDQTLVAALTAAVVPFVAATLAGFCVYDLAHGASTAVLQWTLWSCVLIIFWDGAILERVRVVLPTVFAVLRPFG